MVMISTIHIYTEMFRIPPRNYYFSYYFIAILNKSDKFFFHYTRNFETLIHILKGALGTGILAMPQAFSNAGYVSGFINTLLLGLLCTYCLHVLVSKLFGVTFFNKYKIISILKTRLKHNTSFVNGIVFQFYHIHYQ